MTQIACANLRVRCSAVEVGAYAGPGTNFFLRMRLMLRGTYS